MAQPTQLTTTKTFPTDTNSNVFGKELGAVNTINQFSKTICSNCGKEGKLRCSRCQEIFYCGQECQKTGWKVHKAICFPPNPFGGKASDLRRLMAPFPADSEIACLFKSEDGHITPLTQAEFRQKTGITLHSILQSTSSPNHQVVKHDPSNCSIY